MRETDQAAITQGSYELAEKQTFTAPLIPSSPKKPYYQLDKFWGTYVTNAIFLQAWPGKLADFSLDQVVLICNWSSAFLLFAGVLYLGITLGRQQFTWFRCTCFAAFILTPNLLLSAPLASPNICGCGFFLLLLGSCLQFPQQRLWLGKGLLAFAAVACRADFVLALPLLCWIQQNHEQKSSINRQTITSLLRRKDFLSMGIGACLAVGVGKLLTWGYGGGGFSTPIFIPEAIAAYLVFGCGATLVVALLAVWLLWQQQNWTILSRIFAVVTLFLPVLFYLPLLYSPRHLIVWSATVLACSIFLEKKPFFLANSTQTNTPLSKKLLFCTLPCIGMAAIFPLFFGLILPTPKSPRISLGQASLYPTTDGLWPMGSLLCFQQELAQGEIDHNGKLWNSLKNFAPQTTKPFELQINPHFTFFALTARLNSWSFVLVNKSNLDEIETPLFFERDDLQLGNRLREGNSALPDWGSGRWQAGFIPELIQLLPTSPQNNNSPKPDWAEIALAEFFFGARWQELPLTKNTTTNSQATSGFASFHLPASQLGASGAVSIGNQCWQIPASAVLAPNSSISLLAQKTISLPENTPHVRQAPQFKQLRLEVGNAGCCTLHWKTAEEPNSTPITPRIFFRQFADYMRY